MELGFLGFMAFILVAIVLGLIIYFFRRLYAERDDPENEDIIINGLAAYCDGHALGNVKSKESNKSMVKIVFSPRDINYIKLKDKSYKVLDRTIYVKKNLLLELPLSTHRKMYIALPDRGEHLPGDLIKNTLGSKMSEFVEEMHNETKEGFIMKTQEKNKLILDAKSKGLKVALEIAEMYKGASKDSLNTTVENPKKE